MTHEFSRKTSKAGVLLFLATVAALLASGVAVAETAAPKTHDRQKHNDKPWYAVEVIVFRPANNGAGGGELMPPDPAAPNLTKAVIPGSEAAANAAEQSSDGYVLPLSKKDYKLAGIWKELSRSGRYKPLLHTGWIQPGVPGGQAKNVSITPLVKAPDSTQRVYSDASLTPHRKDDIGNDSNSDNADKRIAPPDAPVFGAITLAHSANRLHLAVDIAWRPAHPATIKTWQAPSETAAPSTLSRPHSTGSNQMGPFPARRSRSQLVILKATRTIKPGALNYFDNPLFGVIVQVRKVKPPKAANAATASANHARQDN